MKRQLMDKHNQREDSLLMLIESLQKTILEQSVENKILMDEFNVLMEIRLENEKLFTELTVLKDTIKDNAIVAKEHEDIIVKLKQENCALNEQIIGLKHSVDSFENEPPIQGNHELASLHADFYALVERLDGYQKETTQLTGDDVSAFVFGDDS